MSDKAQNTQCSTDNPTRQSECNTRPQVYRLAGVLVYITGFISGGRRSLAAGAVFAGAAAAIAAALWFYEHHRGDKPPGGAFNPYGS